MSEEFGDDAGVVEIAALNEAADALLDGTPLPPSARLLIANLLRAEAVLLAELQPFTDLISLAIKQPGDAGARLRLARNEETGDMKMLGDNTSNAVRVARAVLNARGKK